MPNSSAVLRIRRIGLTCGPPRPRPSSGSLGRPSGSASHYSRAGPGSPSVGELKALGVRRVSVGTVLAQAAYAHTHRAAVELLTQGTYTALDGGLDYQTLNTALSADPAR